MWVLSLLLYVGLSVPLTLSIPSWTRRTTPNVERGALPGGVEHDFEYLEQLNQRLERLSGREQEVMSAFWCPPTNTFANHPICMELLSHDCIKGPFHNPAMISVLSRIAPSSLLLSNKSFMDALEILLQRRARLSSHRWQGASTYFRCLNTRALLDVIENGILPPDSDLLHRAKFAAERAHMIAFDDLCRQLAFRQAEDRQNFDIVVLVFSLIMYVQTISRLPAGTLDSQTSSAGSAKLVTAGLRVVFECQQNDGTWEKGEAIERSGFRGIAGDPHVSGGVSASPSMPSSPTSGSVPAVPCEQQQHGEIGNSYVFSVDLLGSLVDSIVEWKPELLAPFLPEIERTVGWMESNLLKERQGGGREPKTVLGWRSNHLTEGSPVGWCTAQVFFTLTRLRKLLRFLLTQRILAEFGGMSGAASGREWRTLMDSDLSVSGRKTTLMTDIENRILIPLQSAEMAVTLTLLPSEKVEELRQLGKEKIPHALSLFEWDSQKAGVVKRRPPSSSPSGLDSLECEDLSGLFEESEKEETANGCDSEETRKRGRRRRNSENSPSPAGNDDATKNEMRGKAIESLLFHFASTAPCYSLILFGPPGTAKSTLCASMANYLGWNFLVVDTSDFLAHGMGEVAARMRYIFDRLKVLERTIILFDEVEEFCQDRTNERLGMESRMLTTAMLTQFNDLRRQQKSVFIVATNRVRSLDAAVIRPGRFDMMLFAGTPNLKSREQRLRSKLQATRLSLEDKEAACRLVTQFMRRRWDDRGAVDDSASPSEGGEGGDRDRDRESGTSGDALAGGGDGLNQRGGRTTSGNGGDGGGTQTGGMRRRDRSSKISSNLERMGGMRLLTFAENEDVSPCTGPVGEGRLSASQVKSGLSFEGNAVGVNASTVSRALQYKAGPRESSNMTKGLQFNFADAKGGWIDDSLDVEERRDVSTEGTEEVKGRRGSRGSIERDACPMPESDPQRSGVGRCGSKRRKSEAEDDQLIEADYDQLIEEAVGLGLKKWNGSARRPRKRKETTAVDSDDT
uniref:AAA+ ATPase domain-containing protein n=1 Tax=Chromera velia CCMP2878 TaxID=1169474 RepID=A0A0G4GTU4_9ALVE|eukprot:Cvel_23365.t1-p1 / transcript=Cvel_23365.t1 / gene=Cvel_23365 / organism=Chromera_velia_CCMP2878 / gene_product=Putative cell division cycle ATPase, putative / transcript_product=Putative cell division cycle ATPase, putative / location=Cvel_scaffold2399:2138-13517(+) / protein_length=1021 / sequence_SO=supercontig / SO=protein_coding / is_pseudo=false